MAPSPTSTWPSPGMDQKSCMCNISSGRIWRRHGKCWKRVAIYMCVGKDHTVWTVIVALSQAISYTPF